MTNIRMFNQPLLFKGVTAIGFFYVCLFASLATAGYMVVHTSRCSIKSYNDIAGQSVEELGHLLNIRQEADAVQIATLRMIFNTEKEDVLTEQETLRHTEAFYARSWKDYAQLQKTPDQRALFDTLMYYRQAEAAARAVLLKGNISGNVSQYTVINTYYTVEKPAYQAYQLAIERLSAHVNAHISAELQKTNSFVAEASSKVNGLLLLSFLMMVVGGVAITFHHKRLLKVKSVLLRERERKQQEITLQTMEAQEKERNQLGRELHDNVNQLLAVTRLNLSLVLQQPGDIDTLVPKSMTYLQQATEEIRCLSKSLVSPLSNEISLYESIQELVNSYSGSVKFLLFLEEIDEDNFSGDIKLSVYRILQEQLNNIFKHAHASMVYIYLTLASNTLTLKVIDDGEGFNITTNRQGIGISNILNRARAYNGTASFDSSPARGCTLQVCFPISKAYRTRPRQWQKKMAALWL